MFISTGGVYQRRFHLREVLKGGIYISFIRGIMVEVYCEARLCLQKCSPSEGLFVLGGEGAFMENRLSVRVCGYMYFR